MKLQGRGTLLITLKSLVDYWNNNRSIFDLAINQPELDMPEILWKSYIDFEMAENELNRVRALYEKLLQRSTHVKVRTIQRKSTRLILNNVDLDCVCTDRV